MLQISNFSKRLLMIGLLIGLIIAAPPAVALVAGSSFAFALGKFHGVFDIERFARICLQSAIVLLGFNIAMKEVISTGGMYLGVGALYILLASGLGLLLASLFGLSSTDRTLITSGTAICGGTAISSVSPLIGAKAEETACALGVVFFLNMIALVLFPWIGSVLELSQNQFGVWAALAIHDTSSVVGAAKTYGAQATDTATIVKLTRTLWLIPLLLLLSFRLNQPGGRIQIPYFVLLFVVASIIGSFTPLTASARSVISDVSHSLLVAALFFIGMQVDRTAIKTMGRRVLGHAVALWLLLIPCALGIALVIED